jgi:CMP-2-keto-3-deoxyoctulosonic acid synthetase
MKASTLCIVDMQPMFQASQEPNTISGVLGLIAKAMKAGAGIVVLEFQGCGETDPRIIQALRGYHRVLITTKSCDDGSSEFLEVCEQRGFYTGRVVVCGVNTDACVQATVFGIKRRLPQSKVVVVGRACNTWTNRDKMLALNVLRGRVIEKGFQNVRILAVEGEQS